MKKAFTLSEILITIVIISIIAIITMPLLYASYTEQERISKIKKTYSTLANAMTRVKAAGGDMIFSIEKNDLSTMKNWFDLYLSPYFITTKICYDESGCWNSGNTYSLNGKIAESNVFGVGIGGGIITATLNDGTFLNLNVLDSAYILRNFHVDIGTDYGVVIYFDINGSKKPNTIGKDIFTVVFTEDGIIPAYKNETSTIINTNCSSSGTGFSCIQKYLTK